MTLRLALRIDGDATGAKRAADDTRAALRQLGKEAKQVPGAGNPFKPLDDGAQKVTNSLGSTRSVFKAFAREAALAGGPLAGMIGQVGTLTIGAGKLGGALVAGTLAVATITAAVYGAVTAFAELEKHQANVGNMLASTHSASGQTVASLSSLTKELSGPGTQSVADIRAAELELLKYKSVGGDAFGSIGGAVNGPPPTSDCQPSCRPIAWLVLPLGDMALTIVFIVVQS